MAAVISRDELEAVLSEAVLIEALPRRAVRRRSPPGRPPRTRSAPPAEHRRPHPRARLSRGRLLLRDRPAGDHPHSHDCSSRWAAPMCPSTPAGGPTGTRPAYPSKPVRLRATGQPRDRSRHRRQVSWRRTTHQTLFPDGRAGLLASRPWSSRCAPSGRAPSLSPRSVAGRRPCPPTHHSDRTAVTSSTTACCGARRGIGRPISSSTAPVSVVSPARYQGGGASCSACGCPPRLSGLTR